MSEMDDLIALLLPKTLEGKIQWELQSDERMYTVQGGSMIEIFYNPFDTASIAVRNNDGLIITNERFTVEEPSFDALGQIFFRAKRNSLRVDETLSDISRRLRAL